MSENPHESFADHTFPKYDYEQFATASSKEAMADVARSLIEFCLKQQKLARQIWVSFETDPGSGRTYLVRLRINQGDENDFTKMEALRGWPIFNKGTVDALGAIRAGIGNITVQFETHDHNHILIKRCDGDLWRVDAYSHSKELLTNKRPKLHIVL